MQVLPVLRGETLIKEGAAADHLYIVNFGLFEVDDPDGRAVALIGAGQLIGEIGFFAGEPRTASVVAARDSEVLAISRDGFEALAARIPELHHAVSRSLSRRLMRLAANARNRAVIRHSSASRIVVIVAAGSGRVPDAFVEALRAATLPRARGIFVGSADASGNLGERAADRYAMAGWLSDIERSHDLVVSIADETLTEWTRAAIRSADQLVLVADGAPEMINSVEALALETFPPARRRLVRIHPRRNPFASPGEAWLRGRDVFMTHHVSMEDRQDVQRLARFLTGQAIGLVASGGGAFGPAHVGIFKAFGANGISFDIFGGSSVGSAMTAAFARLGTIEEIEAGTEDIFVTSRGLKRYTLPRYGLLDHIALDDALRRRIGAERIEDVWKPYYAVATDLSTYAMRVIRSGPIWQAVRASSAIPGILPPFFDDEGHMLVDGGVVDNVPVGVMKSLKNGPNLVIDVAPQNHRVYDLSYASIPGRWALLRQMINPFAGPMPRCPSPAIVIQRSLFGNIRNEIIPNDVHDLMLRPPAFPGSSFMNWERHREVLAASYEWGMRTIESLRADGDSAFAAIERAAAEG
jgi:NTE family protein